jgi:hypothetical protein
MGIAVVVFSLALLALTSAGLLPKPKVGWVFWYVIGPWVVMICTFFASELLNTILRRRSRRDQRPIE